MITGFDTPGKSSVLVTRAPDVCHARWVEPAGFLYGHPVALSCYEGICTRLGTLGAFEVRTTTSQIAFRRAHGFAYLWLPGQHLQLAGAEVVLTIALGREVRSGRFKDVTAPGVLGETLGCYEVEPARNRPG